MKWKVSREYRDFYELLLESEEWSAEYTDKWQLDKVKQIVDYAYEHVPAYKKRYGSVGYEKGAIHSWDDFKKLPTISKDDIKRDFDSFRSDEKIRSNQYFTSGSTGKPMCFFLDVATSERERAMFHYYWSKYGYNYGERCVLLRGQNVNRSSGTKFFKYDQFQNYKVFDSTSVSNLRNLDLYDKEIRKYRAKFIQAYPSALFNFARLYHMTERTAPRFQSIFLGSESVFPDQCEFIKKVFQAENLVYHYGHTECAAIALKYPDVDILGFVPVYGYVEILNGDHQCAIGEIGEIVATGFNKSMPFIRYRTGDYTCPSAYHYDGFMKNYKAVDIIEGRKQEYVVTYSHRLIPIVWFCGQHMKMLNLVDDFQYQQEEVGKLIVKVTGFQGEPVTEDTIRILETAYQKYFDDLDIEIRPVKEIDKNSRGKRISMIQKLDTDIYR